MERHDWRRARLGALALATLGLAACNDGEALPQLAAAVGAAYSGDCASLATSLAGLEHTQITLAETVAAGTVVSGVSVAEHCRVTGKMYQRTSAVDGKTYAIGFELRLPKSWNGRFLHQGNGGIDGDVKPAAG